MSDIFKTTARTIAETAIELIELLADRKLSNFERLDALQIAQGLMQQQINRELMKAERK